MPASSTEAADRIRHNILGRGLEIRPLSPSMDVGVDLALVRGPTGIDFGQVADLPNLEQALKLALTTALGSDVFNTEFGFDGLNALAEESDRVIQRERIRVSIIRLLQQDARIKRIVDVKLAGGQFDRPAPTAGKTEGERAENRRILDVSVIFETLTGDQAQLSFAQVPANV